MKKLIEVMKYPLRITIEMSKFAMIVVGLCYFLYGAYDLLIRIFGL